MRRIQPVTASVFLLPGCGSDLQHSHRVKALRERTQALEQPHEELEAHLEQGHEGPAHLVKMVGDVKAYQQAT